MAHSVHVLLLHMTSFLKQRNALISTRPYWHSFMCPTCCYVGCFLITLVGVGSAVTVNSTLDGYSVVMCLLR